LKKIFQGGKSGLHRGGRRVTPGGSNPWKRATENRPPAAKRALSSLSAGKGEKVG